jgi:DNA ligase-4
MFQFRLKFFLNFYCFQISDFACFAGYFAGGRRLSGIVSHFILGVAVKENGQTVPTEFRSFCRVGSGYSNKDLFSLLQKLQPHFRKGGIPSHLKFGREKPDVWIDPKKSVVVQIKAAEIVVSDGFDVGCTLRYLKPDNRTLCMTANEPFFVFVTVDDMILVFQFRFPRVEQVRYDKSWTDCMTLEELQSLRGRSDGKLARKAGLDEFDVRSYRNRNSRDVSRI